MRVFFITGSGLSADSGIPTFSGKDGIYQSIGAEEFLSAAHYVLEPEPIEKWLDDLRQRIAAASPNAAHYALAAYQERHPQTLLFTQNVDSLLERAGTLDVIHLHGRLDRLRCLGHSHISQLSIGEARDPAARCAICGSRLRTDVVLFGERAPEYATLWRSLRRARPSDVLVVVGTQGLVLPVEGIVRRFPGRKLLNNLHHSDTLDVRLFDRVINAPAAIAIESVIHTINQWNDEYYHSSHHETG